MDVLCARYGLDPVARQRLEALTVLVTRDPEASTTIRAPEHVIQQHLSDSLVALELGVIPRSGRVVDIGSGAGFPGLPLAVALPGIEFTLLESNGRKCHFLERAAALCGLANIQIANARAESWPEGLGIFDLATARALAPLAVVAELAAPLLLVGGRLLVWRGKREAEDEAVAGRAAAALGFEVGEITRVQPFPSARDRHLHLMLKVSDTPARFPRRPGMAAKRPVGSSDRLRR